MCNICTKLDRNDEFLSATTFEFQRLDLSRYIAEVKYSFGVPIRGCQIGMQGPQLFAEPRHFCKLDVATSRIACLDLNLNVLQVATSSNN